MKRPTQVDVARKAGVSRATVSNVLNKQSDRLIQISEETRQRVLDVVEELGYQVDARAQALRGGNTKTIGVLLPIYENPYFWQILIGISEELEASGYSLLLAHNSVTPEQENETVRELAEQRVDGMIMLIGFNLLTEQVKEQLRKSDRPVVEITGTESEFDYVHGDYSNATRALMSHLFDLGHTRIAYIKGATVASQGFDRLIGYRKAYEETGLPYDENLVYECGELMEDGYQATRDLLSQPNPPTAIITINDLLAMAAMRAVADMGLRIPQDVSIAGFDDIPFTNFIIPRLTTVASNPKEQGRNAVRLLLKRLKDPDRPQEVIVGGGELIIRESTGPAPV